MNDVIVRVPVTCPICAKESLTPLAAGAILEAMESISPLRLRAHCHAQAWDATPREIDQLGDYLLESYKLVSRKETINLSV